jgi:hypothetical protein
LRTKIQVHFVHLLAKFCSELKPKHGAEEEYSRNVDSGRRMRGGEGEGKREGGKWEVGMRERGNGKIGKKERGKW